MSKQNKHIYKYGTKKLEKNIFKLILKKIKQLDHKFKPG